MPCCVGSASAAPVADMKPNHVCNAGGIARIVAARQRILVETRYGTAANVNYLWLTMRASSKAEM
jgi:hypothetical protein